MRLSSNYAGEQIVLIVQTGLKGDTGTVTPEMIQARTDTESFRDESEGFSIVSAQEAGISEDHADKSIAASIVSVDAKNVGLQYKADTLALRNETQQIKEGVEATIGRKIDNWQVDTKADADLLKATLNNSAFIEVLADETQGDQHILYFWNTVTLQEPLLL